MSTLIGCPEKIETVEQARRLPKIGEKIALKVQEFLETGKIQEAIDLQTNEKFIALKKLQTVHGIGFTTANSLYEQGFRTIQDLRDRNQYVSQLEHYEDLQEKIPREEVELIAEFVKVQIDKCRPDVSALVEICGGYRRGKDYSNDVDLLITYPHRLRKRITRGTHRAPRSQRFHSNSSFFSNSRFFPYFNLERAFVSTRYSRSSLPHFPVTPHEDW